MDLFALFRFLFATLMIKYFKGNQEEEIYMGARSLNNEALCQVK